MSTLAHHWLRAGTRAWTMLVAALLAGMLGFTLLLAGGFAGAFAWLPPTWFETQRSPGYVLNGRFQGAWVLERDSQPLEPGWEHLELRVTEDLGLLDDAHPEQFMLPRGVVARGTAASRGFSSTFELVSDGRLFLEFGASPAPLRAALSLDARDPGRLDTMSLYAADGRSSTYRRDVWFLPSP